MKFVAMCTACGNFTALYFNAGVENGVECSGWHHDIGRAKRFASRREAIDFIGDCGMDYVVVQVPDVTREIVIDKVRECLIQKRDNYYALTPDFVVTGFDSIGRMYQIDSRSGQFQHVVVTDDLKRDEFGRSYSCVVSLTSVWGGVDGEMKEINQVSKLISDLEKVTNISIKFVEHNGWDNFRNCPTYCEVSRLVQDTDCVSFSLARLHTAFSEKLVSERCPQDVYFHAGKLVIDVHMGDWKHDHLFVQNFVRKFMAERDVVVDLDDSQITESTGGDCYSAEYIFAEVK